ncbi:MAG TPA: TetR/AcrR family transcriptional regulator [Chitinophagales bacterium]|nr:TetR/AcrR family transcriptional regulator [Chitinophagales bacterium]
MPRRPEQFKAIREKSREKILGAALQLFAYNGYDATSIDSIAKKAGVSKGLIYNYFESKKDILLAIFGEAMKMGEEMVMGEKDTSDPYERKRGMVNRVFDALRNEPEYMKLLTVMSLQPGVMDEAKAFTREAYKKSKEWSGVLTGKTGRKAWIEALMMGTLMDGITLNYILYGKQFPLEALRKEIIKVYCTPPAKAKKKG